VSLSSSLARVLARPALGPGPTRPRFRLPPRRLPVHRTTAVAPSHRMSPAVQAALARWVDAERPLAPVERIAAASRADRPALRAGDDSLVPGNGRAHGRPLPRRAPVRSVVSLPSAPTPDLGSCVACGGPLRVAVVDLAGGSAALECVACGLRRIEAHGSAPESTPARSPWAVGSDGAARQVP
jgi:hypothetical protein